MTGPGEAKTGPDWISRLRGNEVERGRTFIRHGRAWPIEDGRETPFRPGHPPLPASKKKGVDARHDAGYDEDGE
jgi:hypothetical protein